MPSFSTIFATLLAATSAFAYTTPTTFNVTLDPVFTPTLGQLVPVGSPFKITWKPTESGTVTLVLLRGPSTNVQPLEAIAESIKNTGSFEWTPKTSLEPDTTHYGIQLISDATGEYQYSVQFGIKNANFKPSTTSSSSHTGSATSSESTSTSYATVTHTTHSSVTSVVTITTSTSSSSSSMTMTSVPLSTYTPPATNSSTTIVTKTTSSATLSTSAQPTQSPNAASGLKAASGLLAGVAGVAVLLL